MSFPQRAALRLFSSFNVGEVHGQCIPNRTVCMASSPILDKTDARPFDSDSLDLDFVLIYKSLVMYIHLNSFLISFTLSTQLSQDMSRLHCLQEMLSSPYTMVPSTSFENEVREALCLITPVPALWTSTVSVSCKSVLWLVSGA